MNILLKSWKRNLKLKLYSLLLLGEIKIKIRIMWAGNYNKYTGHVRIRVYSC